LNEWTKIIFFIPLIMKRVFSFRKPRILLWTGFLLGVLLVFAGHTAVEKTSGDKFCAACHVHPQATASWKRSTHYDNRRGIHVHCVDCHLPPKGEGYLPEKVKTGARDVWGKLFKDPGSFNWEAKSQPGNARKHTFESSCIHCHRNNFPIGLSVEGKDAHLYYEDKREDLHCINCHITVGHYTEGVSHAKNLDFGKKTAEAGEVFTEAGSPAGFSNFTEFIPGTRIQFEMIAVPGGNFLMGSPPEEPLRREDEGPQREVRVSPLFMAKHEVSWDEYLAFYKETSSQGKTADAYLNVDREVDAISGPTPPWGAPDQGWGKQSAPAITMTHHAAEVYCEWLSSKTGKKYRLPTEAEWEYAARGGTQGPYFFEGDPARFAGKGLFRGLFGADTGTIATYVIYNENSPGKTVRPGSTRENPFGLVNMLGNVAEFCQDWYSPDTYSTYPEGSLHNPEGPPTGKEHVVRGGSYKDGAGRVRCAARDYTRTESWLKTDPQIPKSIWWYSDCTFVGFRVVCEIEN
jgi:formylglycine-generating enzyme required for sulfatase activity/nitrate/TMAO reductase-like tetraheme cytochrome c subunit